MKTADKINADIVAADNLYFQLVRIWKAEVENPLIKHVQNLIAADMEWESWLDVMRLEREDRCPDGKIHREDPQAAKPGYYALCTRCGHNTMLPF